MFEEEMRVNIRASEWESDPPSLSLRTVIYSITRAPALHPSAASRAAGAHATGGRADVHGAQSVNLADVSKVRYTHSNDLVRCPTN